MNKGIFFVLMLVNTLISFGQNGHFIEGKVVDSITKKPLAYVNIYADNYRGTISNSEGNFVLKVAPSTKFISISFLGYKNKEYSIKDIPHKIELHPIPFELNEVVIKAIDVNKLIVQIIDKYKSIKKQKNQEISSFFYRQTTKTDMTCNEILEAFFNANSIIDVSNLKLETGRYAKLKDDSLNHYMTFINFFYFSQITPFHIKKPKENNVVVPLQPDFRKYYKVSVDVLRNSENNSLIYKLSFMPLQGINRPILQGNLLIDPTNLLILKFKGELFNMPLSFSDKEAVMKNDVMQFSILYDTTNGISKVATVNNRYSYNYVLPTKTIKVSIHSVLFNVGNKYITNNDKKLKSKTYLIYKIAHNKYDPSFWHENPIIKRTPLEHDAIKIFEKRNLFGTFRKEPQK